MSKRRISNVIPLENSKILLEYENEGFRIFDVTPYISGEWYGRLGDSKYFSTVHPCGNTVEWADGQDIAPHELWDNSVPYVSAFNGLMSFSEAASKWSIDDSTLRKAVTSGRLIENIDVKKFGKQWVISESAMKRLFGNNSDFPSAV